MNAVGWSCGLDGLSGHLVGWSRSGQRSVERVSVLSGRQGVAADSESQKSDNGGGNEPGPPGRSSIVFQSAVEEFVSVTGSECFVVVDAVLASGFARALVAVSWARETASISEEKASVASLAASR